MATFEKGYMGGFSGTAGPAVGSTWKKLNVLRSRPPRKRRGTPSDLQVEQQSKFGLITNFLRPLTDLLNQTYNKSASGEMSGYNKGFSVNSEAIAGVYPAITVDYAKVLLSKGRLLNVNSPVVVSTAAGKLQFSWTDNSAQEKNGPLSSDFAYVAAYNEELGHWIFVQKAVTRNTGTYTLDVVEFSGKPVQCYIGIMSVDRRRVSLSKYLGAVNVL